MLRTESCHLQLSNLSDNGGNTEHRKKPLPRVSILFQPHWFIRSYLLFNQSPATAGPRNRLREKQLCIGKAYKMVELPGTAPGSTTFIPQPRLAS